MKALPPNVSGVKTRSQLAEEYQISRRTLYNWLQQAGIGSKGKLLTPMELAKVYQKFGRPRSRIANKPKTSRFD